MESLYKERVLMCYVSFSTFIRRDIEILSEEYIVDQYHFKTTNKALLPFTFLKQFIFLLFNTKKYKAIITQSGGYLSFLPVIFNFFFKVPVVIIAIGTDCAKLPEINYGAQAKTPLNWFTNFSFKNATLILPVHKSLEESKYTYLNIKNTNQGIRAFNPKIKTKIIELVNGYDTKKWHINNNTRKENSFLTVTLALNKAGYYRKGIDLIIEAAKKFPEYKFTIVGQVILFEQCPKNITIINNIPQEELIQIYNKHQYYLQLSMFEGFPNALCEAMLCGCIPIGSNVAGIPDIINDKGYIITQKNKDNLFKIIEEENKNNITPIQVRNQIANNFPLERRKKEFLDHIRIFI